MGTILDATVLPTLSNLGVVRSIRTGPNFALLKVDYILRASSWQAQVPLTKASEVGHAVAREASVGGGHVRCTSKNPCTSTSSKANELRASSWQAQVPLTKVREVGHAVAREASVGGRARTLHF